MIKLADKRKKSIEMFNNEIEKLKFLGKDIELTEFKYKEYSDNFNGYFYHLISKKYLKSLKEKGLVPSKMLNLYMYIQDAIEMDGAKIKIPKYLEGLFVGKTIRDAEIGRNADIETNDIICRFKRKYAKNYIYEDIEAISGDDSYLILISILPEMIEVMTNHTDKKWIPLTEWKVEKPIKIKYFSKINGIGKINEMLNYGEVHND